LETEQHPSLARVRKDPATIWEPLFMKRIIAGTLVLGVCAVLIPGVASARPAYRMAFLKNYDIKADSAIAKAQCGLCHVGQDKKNRNAYGKDLAKALGKEMASPEEAVAAFKKVEGMKSPDKAHTYLELIKMDKLPGAAPE